MEDRERVAIGTVVMRNTQYLTAVRPLDGVLAMSTMRFADEVVPRADVDGLPSRRSKPEPKAMKMANMLVDSLASDWDPERYHDTYTEELRKRITAKGSGKKVAEEETSAPKAEVLDLMAALERSVEATRAKKQPARRSRRRKTSPTSRLGPASAQAKKSAKRSAARPSRRRPASDRLDRYRAKRDFDRTCEPEGAPRRHRATVIASWSNATGHVALHYDVRLEADGVLISWAVPKGPTLDPDVRRLAVHVEDHPLEYFDFEGVIPDGEYGGGDVIVWDWGTWTPARGTDPLQAIDDGNLHFDLARREAARPVRPRAGRAAGEGGCGKEQWLMLHKHDKTAVAGWDPEEYPRSVKSGRTNDEVKAAPAASWSSNKIWAAPTADELDALDALGKSGRLAARRAHGPPDEPRQGAVPGAPAAPGDHEARPDPVLRQRRPGDAAVPRRSTGEPAPLPGRHRQEGLLAQGGTRPRARLDRTVAQRRRRPRRDRVLPRARHAGRARRGRRTTARSRSIRGRRRSDDSARPTWAMIDIDPGSRGRLRRRADARPAPPRRARPPRRPSRSEGHREAGHPDLGARGDRYTFDETRDWVEALSRMIGAAVPELVSWEWKIADRARAHPPRLHAERGQQDARRAVQRPTRAPGAPVSVPITWDELDDPDLRPDRWTIAAVGSRIAEAGDPLAPLLGLQQVLPAIG